MSFSVGTRGKTESVNFFKANFFNEPVGFLEIEIGFGRKADDDVGAKRNVLDLFELTKCCRN